MSLSLAIESEVIQTSMALHFDNPDINKLRCPIWKRSKVPPIRPTSCIFPPPVVVCPGAWPGGLHSKARAPDPLPGTFVGLWGSSMIHSLRSSGDLSQSGHLFCSSDHSVADSHTGLDEWRPVLGTLVHTILRRGASSPRCCSTGILRPCGGSQEPHGC